jgi:arylsulfatase A-like enzyme
VPEIVRWPGKIPAGVVSNEIVHHNDWLPTFLALAGDPDIGEKLKKGHKAGEKQFKAHLDGKNLVPYLTGEQEHSPRRGFVYIDDDQNVVALRMHNWKVVFLEQRCEGTLAVWSNPFTVLRVPKLFNLRMDPFERADITSNTYWDWFLTNDYMVMASQMIIGEFLESFKEFPPVQRAASFTIDQAMEKLMSPVDGT